MEQIKVKFRKQKSLKDILRQTDYPELLLTSHDANDIRSDYLSNHDTNISALENKIHMSAVSKINSEAAEDLYRLSFYFKEKIYKNKRIQNDKRNKTNYYIAPHDYDYGMTSESALCDYSFVDKMINLIIDYFLMGRNYRNEWLSRGVSIKTLLFKNPRLSKCIHLCVVLLTLNTTADIVSRQLLVDKTRQIVFKKGIFKWLTEYDGGEYSVLTDNMIAHTINFTDIETTHRTRFFKNKESIKTALRGRGFDVISDSIWLTNSYGRYFLAIGATRLVRNMMKQIYMKLIEHQQHMINAMSQNEQRQVQYVLTSIGSVPFVSEYAVESLTRFRFIDKILLELKQYQRKFIHTGELDLCEFDDDSSSLTAYFLNNHFDMIYYAVAKDCLKAISNEIYGDENYILNALQIILNHLINKYLTINIAKEIIRDMKRNIHEMVDNGFYYTVEYRQEYYDRFIYVIDLLDEWCKRK